MMERQREDVERARSERRGERQRDRLVEEKPTNETCTECWFEVAHVTWLRRTETREPIELGQASEPMS